MKYQAIMLTTPDNITKLFALSEWFQSSHQDKKILLGNEVIRIL
ncbi:hypothetical protein BTN50_2049 [Candidatus Enterovibrio altilux]|uniref:Uncharacterized protein n=1 Tax=Candidatus Enterovibrio altilux TaxID=1927128 RepID=A0A291BBR2_9GAMM|nr:hypothetical protein BTN50_2049 [Candidatus Enterovibrio luxaltus]